MAILINGWATIPKTELPSEALDSFRQTFRMVPIKVGDHPGDPPDPFNIYEETDTDIRIPRQFVLDRKPASSLTLDVVTNEALWPQQLSFQGTLEGDQIKCVETVCSRFKSGLLGGIVQAVPGYGKTVVSTAMIATLALPTLVLVHKEFLVKQWTDRLQTFLPGIKIGKVRQDKCDYKDKHVVVAMVQSLWSRTYEPEFYRYFGLIVTDEVHRIGAPTWSQVLPQFAAKYRLGLSATPRRSDGLGKVFQYHIGDVIYRGNISRLDCAVKRIFTNVRLPESKFQNPRLVTSSLAQRLLAGNKQRNQQILALLIEAYKAGRKIMVMSHLKEKHLFPLKQAFDAQTTDLVRRPVSSFYFGGLSQAQRDEAEKADVIFATVQMTKEGLDIPSLDTLFLVSPMGNIEQAVGRIQRVYAGKKDPMVVDFRDDEIPICRDLARNRWRFYASKGWVEEENFSVST